MIRHLVLSILTVYLVATQCQSTNKLQPQAQPCDCDGPTRKAIKDIEAVVRPGLGEGNWFLYARGLNGGQDLHPYSLCNVFPVELQREGVHILIQDSDLPTVACPGERRASSSLNLNQYRVLSNK